MPQPIDHTESAISKVDSLSPDYLQVEHQLNEPLHIDTSQTNSPLDPRWPASPSGIETRSSISSVGGGWLPTLRSSALGLHGRVDQTERRTFAVPMRRGEAWQTVHDFADQVLVVVIATKDTCVSAAEEALALPLEQVPPGDVAYRTR